MKVVFLDRDGVICHNRPDHVKNWDEFLFLERSREAIARLTQAGLPVVIVTNQSAINRGLTTVEAVEQIHQRMVAELEAHGGRVAGVYYCPHRPDEGCECRKPRPGLLLQAARELGISLQDSYLVGDAVSDIQAAQAAGVPAYMVLTGRGQQQYLESIRQGMGDFRPTLDLWQAVDSILRLESPLPVHFERIVSQPGVLGP
ncbi:MAG: D-glycero-beta-D-manno-heptose 1,7-bisphosphate 7-phosphatase [Chloroflexota bacterium]